MGKRLCRAPLRPTHGPSGSAPFKELRWQAVSCEELAVTAAQADSTASSPPARWSSHFSEEQD